MPTLRVPRLGGVDERPNASPDHARSIIGMRFDASEGRWVSDRGYISYWPSAPARGAAGATYSLHLHETLGGATKDILVERDDGSGTTGIYRIKPYASGGVLFAQIGRHTPGTQEPGTCFASFGRVCIAVNGWDQPLRIYPTTDDLVRAEPFGFQRLPAPPVPAAVSGDSMRGSTTAYYYSLSNDISDVTTAYPVANSVGLGSPTGGDTNTYRYRYTWVTDTGSESPASFESPAVNWDTNSDGYRYGILITGIQTGPAGTVKRRLYRTKNLGETQALADATYYFLADIPNNWETAFTDHVPDGLLGSAAPDALNSAPLPAALRWVVSHAGRLWAVSGDYRVHWSQAGQIEAFGAADYVDVSSRAGGRVTGLIPNNDLLLVLRERALEAIVAAQTGTGYRAVPIVESIGSRAPHAAISVPGWGVLIVADDGIYSVRGSFSGGGTLSVRELTDRVAWDSVNTRALARAWAWLNLRDREVIFALPTSGYTYPTMHLVLHLDAGGGVDDPAWSRRYDVQSSCGITGPEGWPYMGDSGGSTTQQPLLISTWAAYNQYGYTTDYEPLARPESHWETVDLDLGNPDEAKVVRYVTATVSAYGDALIYLDAYLDSGWEQQGTTQTSPTHVLDRQELTVLGTAVIGTDDYNKRIVSEVRFDLEVYHVRRIRLRFRSENVWALYSYAVHFEETGPLKPFSPVTRSTTFTGAPTVNVPASKLPGGIR